MLAVKVDGVARPQGSKKAYLRGGKIVLVEASADLKPWREKVSTTLIENIGEWVKAETTEPVKVRIEFHLPKPPSVRRFFVTVPPDVDKLIRAVLDAITISGVVWHDDSQVVRIAATKQYANAEPHAIIEVSRV